MVTLDQAIDTVLELPPEQQEMLLEIIHRRQVEARRQEIARDAQHALAAFRAGMLKSQTVDAVLAELHASLNNADDNSDNDNDVVEQACMS